MELADMQDLGSCAVRRGGSSPFIRTKVPYSYVKGCGVFFTFLLFVITNQASSLTRLLWKGLSAAKTIHRIVFAYASSSSAPKMPCCL